MLASAVLPGVGLKWRYREKERTALQRYYYYTCSRALHKSVFRCPAYNALPGLDGVVSYSPSHLSVLNQFFSSLYRVVKVECKFTHRFVTASFRLPLRQAECQNLPTLAGPFLARCCFPAASGCPAASCFVLHLVNSWARFYLTH